MEVRRGHQSSSSYSANVVHICLNTLRPGVVFMPLEFSCDPYRLLSTTQSTCCPLLLTHQRTMGAILQIVSYVLFLASLPLISALKFDIAAHNGHESAKYERCIRNFVAKDQLVVVTANVDGNRGDGQQLNLHVRGAYNHGIVRQY
jgi:hypothetical protein